MNDQHEENRNFSVCYGHKPPPLPDSRPRSPAQLKIKRRRPQPLGCSDDETALLATREARRFSSMSSTRRLASHTYDGTETCLVERRRLVAADVYLDGAQSTSSSSGSEAPNDDARQPPIVHNGTTITNTLNVGRRPNMLTALWSDSEFSRRRNRRQALTEESPFTRGGLTRVSDRFVPSRESSGLMADRFRTVKDSHRLSTSERIVRNEAAMPDPFIPRSQRFAAARPTLRGSRSDGSDRRNGEPSG